MKKRNQTGKSGVAAAGGKMWALMLCLALFTGLLTGCGGKNGQGNGQNNGEEQVKTETLTVKGDEYYELTIKPIPNANRNIVSTLPPDGILQDGWEGMEGSFSCVGTTVYRICSSWNVDESTGQQVFGRDKQYVQYLEEPYEEWVDLPVSQEAWQQDVIWSAHQFRVDEDNRMFILLSSWNAADEQLEYAIGELYRDGRQVLIQQGLEEEQAILLMDSQGGEAEPLVYDQMYAVAKGSDIATAHDDAGDLYFGTKQKVWHYNGKETIEVLDFREQDVALKSLINMAVVENGFLFLGSFGEQYYLVEAQRVEEPVIVEKQEIVLADSYVGEELQDAVAGFNMQSREYRVVIRQATGLTEEEKEKFQREIQLELVEGAGPDILGMYVGESEKNIRQAFEEAERTNSILLFDEADSFFADRNNAQHSWERTMVNEFLTQMEEFKGILICTTNLKHIMDSAMQRRFHFCVEFKPLEKSGIQTMLEKYFPEYGFTKDEIKTLEASGSITPGDFGSLSSRIRFMNQDKVNSSVITKELIDLQKEKKNGSFCQKMGF